METLKMEKCPCVGVLSPVPIYQKLMVDNLTVIRPPILKLYYWESFDITGLNKKLRSNKREFEHVLAIPLRQIQSQPLKIIFWLRNMSAKPLELKLKRVQNCQCQPLQTRVGFNQFRQLFHCPHRRLIHVSQELLNLLPDEVLPISVTAHFFLYGEHYLTYEIYTNDDRKLIWTFKLEVTAFDPERCLLTKELLPVNIRNFRHVTQPIWVQNITMTHLSFNFYARERSFKLHNSSLTVPRQSVWPLLVEYRPLDYENEVEVMLSYESVKARYKIKARGAITDEHEVTDMPLKDRESAEYLYVIYPNRLSFELCIKESRTQLVNLHNYGQKCMEFRWQNYIISDFFAVTFEPSTFLLKGHHSKLCEIKVSVFERLLFFRRIPIVLEVHRVLDTATQIAKAELAEVESIDDPKWKEDSYVEHVFLHLNIRVHLSSREERDDDSIVEVDGACSPCGGVGLDPAAAGDASPVEKLTEAERKLKEREELVKRLSMKRKLTANEVIELSMAIDHRVTIFEKLFWKFLSKSNFMRIPAERTRNKFSKTYDEVVMSDLMQDPFNASSQVDHNTILSILSRLMVEALNDLAKNWIFIPSEFYERDP
ncbi:uncharacterized protein LOC6576607 [Drosophila mojavensis]|uniref:Uncharacterized protein, isoform A n=1 Tax=Drosophila mojavensis TaxID=7230 RepID=B4KFD8_DROMO|nr:uncharacterized protein LOC6576607 [Drosophila mojavensis]EDW12038.2 uncharacterized protein Dmoj_GI17468, isoform A [Drosophila mojavensis]